MPDVRLPANAVVHLVERHLAGQGDAVAVVDDHGSWTFADLSGACDRAAAGLQRLGVRAGDRVVVALPDGRESAAALIGAMRIGAIAVPLDPEGPPAHRDAVVDDCVPRLVVDNPGVLDGRTARPGAAGLPEDPALIVYTSGTTGRPKGVVHAHRTLSPAGPSFLRDVVGVGPGDRCHAAARTSTALGFFIGLARPLAAGATAVLSASRTSPRRTIDLVSEHGVTVLAAVPTLWAQIASVLRRDPDGARRLAALRTSLSSGDRLPAGLAEEMAGLGCHLVDALGSSECGDVYLSESGDGRGAGVLGHTTPGIELRCGAGAAPLWVRTPCAALGYWRRPELTARLRRGAWTRTEDVVVRESCGYRLLGRSDDLFKVGGRLVSPLEIERALAEHPLIAEAAVVGTPQRGGLTRPAAFVVTAGGGRASAGLERELQRLVARRLAPDLAPGRVAVLQTLPRLAGGKLDRRALSAVAAAA
jgi:acyl-coenzyme A synthetase/AMP-(fatty) acid ligase